MKKKTMKKRKKVINIMAWNYKRFRARYQWENNPCVEPTTLLKVDGTTTLIYVHKDGNKTEYTAKEFFEKKLWTKIPAVSDGFLMAWDFPEFRTFFQKENNPDIDPYTLRKRDNEKQLLYINRYGVEITYTPYIFFVCELWKTAPEKRHEMAMDYEEFRNMFQPENNPSVDPYTLRKWADEPTIVYINQFGYKSTYTPHRFFSNELWKIAPYKKYLMAMDYKEFRDTFQPENNPGIDPYTLRKRDNEKRLKHISIYGIETYYYAYEFFLNKMWEYMPYKKYEMAMDYEEFRDFFQPENNPEVNPYTLRKWYDYTPLIHINQHGVVINYTADRFFNTRMWEYMPYQKYEMAMDYEEFRDFFQPENNPEINPYTLRKWDKKPDLLHINQYGVEINYNPDYFFRKELWKTAPHRRYEIGKRVNVLELDEDIALYVQTEKEKEELIHTGVYIEKAFRCPFCGGDFVKKLAEMINCSPKCPFCKDTGFYEEADDEEINGTYLRRI